MVSSEFLDDDTPLPLNLKNLDEENEKKQQMSENFSDVNEEVTKVMQNDISEELSKNDESFENPTKDKIEIPVKTAEKSMINIRAPEQTVKKLTPRITVVGVGGAGGNAVNNMIEDDLKGVDFIVANTDAQALAVAKTERSIQLGLETTQGLGAGSRPEVGKAAAEETLDQIIEEIQGSNMVFITAGMGGGTGTGAAPVIARAAREQGILTVGVVTKPFQFEGVHRTEIAENGIEELSQHVDTLIVIPNQNLFIVANEKTTLSDAFKMADDVLYSGVRSVTDLIVRQGLINLDFADIKTAMSNMGKAMMGTGEAEGENRSMEAAETAIRNPLLDNTSMKGARSVLINITGGMDLTLLEVDEATRRITDEVGAENNARIIFGACFDDELEGKIRVSVVATGLDGENEMAQPQLSPYSFGQNKPVKIETQTQEYQPTSIKIEEPKQEKQEKIVEEKSQAIPVMPSAVKSFEAIRQGSEISEKQEVEKQVDPAPSMPGQLGGYSPQVANIPAKPVMALQETQSQEEQEKNQEVPKQEDLFIPQAPAEVKEVPNFSNPVISQSVSYEQPKAETTEKAPQKSSTIFEKVVGIGMMGRKHKPEAEPEPEHKEPEFEKPVEEKLEEANIPEYVQHDLEKPAYIRNDIDIPDFLRRKNNG